MVLGLIDFLLGGKKKTKVPKSGQITTPLTGVGGNTENSAAVPNGTDIPTENVSGQQAQQVQERPVSSESSFSSSGDGQKKSLSEVLSKINSELKATNEKVTELVTEVKGIENSVNTLGHRLDELEESKKIGDEKFSEIESNMSKFLSLYELVNNQYNPFVENQQSAVGNASIKEIMLDSNGNSYESSGSGSMPKINSIEDIPDIKKDMKTLDVSKASDLDSSLLELDTLNIEEAAGDAVPLTRLKNNTNSLVIILSWLEYLIKKVGIDETRNTLRYYTEVLRWITPEVYFDLDKYLRGMRDKKNMDEDEKLNVKDHIVSLYFISKLNEKTLDEKLTRAVLQIIKQ